MHTKLLFAAVIALFCSAGVNADDSLSLPHKVEPVLVQVDARGKVTQVSPAYELPPRMSKLLNANIDEMIRAPATDKHGKPVSSQFVMNVALQTEPNGTGDYQAHFTCVSTSPVPPGNWYWVHLEGDLLALANQDRRVYDRRPYAPMQRSHDGYRPAYKGDSQPAPVVQNAARSVSTPPPSSRSPSSR